MSETNEETKGPLAEAIEETEKSLEAIEADELEKAKATEANRITVAAQDFSSKLYDLIKEYNVEIPLVYMMKIVNAVSIDLYAALLGTNLDMNLKMLREELEAKYSTKESKLIVG